MKKRTQELKLMALKNFDWESLKNYQTTATMPFLFDGPEACFVWATTKEIKPFKKQGYRLVNPTR